MTPSEIPDDYWPMLAKIESNGEPYVKAGSSTASGLYQLTRASWLREGGEWGDNRFLAFGGLRPSPEEQLKRAKSFTEKNVAVLKSRGIPINKSTLYAAHFFGATLAAMVIDADAKAGAGILRDMSQGALLEWLRKKTEEAS